MHNRSDAGQNICTTGMMQDRPGKMLYSMDAGKDRCRIERLQDKSDAEQDGCRTGWMQDRSDAGQEGCRA